MLRNLPSFAEVNFKVNFQPFGLDLVTLSTSMLGSSCCMVQLLLNAISVPCAGFAVLTPYRGAFFSMFVANFGYSVWKSWKENLLHLHMKRHLLIGTISTIIFISPDIVRKINERRIISTQTVEIVELEIGGIKCDACANSVKNQLSKVPGVISTQVYAQNHLAVVHCTQAGIPEDEFTNSLIHGKFFIKGVLKRTLFTVRTNIQEVKSKVLFQVSGITCGGCSNTINQALSQVVDVLSVSTNVKTGLVEITSSQITADVTILEAALPKTFKVDKKSIVLIEDGTGRETIKEL
jgi:copper chaperone CopZ